VARILHVLRPTAGGAFGHALTLGEAFTERGHQVAVCGPHERRRADLEARGIELIPLEIARPVSPLADAASGVGLARVYRRFRPDLIHAHGSKGGILARAARAARPSAPLVFTPHQYAFANYFADHREQRTYRLVERSMAPLATRVLCVCEWERDLAAEIGPRSRTRVVHNGIEPSPPAPASPLVAELAARGPVIVAAAELHERKGVVSLVEAMPGVLRKHPGVSLVVAGDGEERANLERRRDELGLGDVVRFLGHVDGVDSLLSAADVFVNPAWAEAFPYTVLEAMRAGAAIVATDVGGTGEAIEEGVTGRLVAGADPEALVGAIDSLLADRDLARRLGDAARARLEQQFTRAGMIAGTVEVYAELGVR
jgi:glycosyltransferase involved in cell wall biosynthesis